MSYFILDEHLSISQALAIVTIIAGIVLTSADLRKLKHIHAAKGIKEALISMVFFGLFYSLSGYAARKTDFLTVFIIVRIALSFFLVLFSIHMKTTLSKKDTSEKGIIFPLIAITIIFNAAFILFNYGLETNLVSLITSLSSMYPAITVTLALIFFKEKLVANQKIGILTLLVGMLLLGIS